MQSGRTTKRCTVIVILRCCLCGTCCDLLTLVSRFHQQNMSLDHPPAKSVLYHCQAIATAVDALKMHPDSAHVHRQGLALLFNLIAPDLYAKYSLAHARQSLLANGIVDVVEHAKVAFKKERDIVATCRAISNTMMVDFS